MNPERGYGLVGVLVAVLILGGILFFIFRFNHRIEKRFYQHPERGNRLRLEAWHYVEGRIPDQPVAQVLNLDREGVRYHRIVLDGVSFYVLAPE